MVDDGRWSVTTHGHTQSCHGVYLPRMMLSPEAHSSLEMSWSCSQLFTWSQRVSFILQPHHSLCNQVPMEQSSKSVKRVSKTLQILPLPQVQPYIHTRGTRYYLLPINQLGDLLSRTMIFIYSRPRKAWVNVMQHSFSSIGAPS